MIIANNTHGLVSKKLNFLNKNNKELNYDVSKSRGSRTCMLMWVVVGKGLGVGVSASFTSSCKRTYCIPCKLELWVKIQPPNPCSLQILAASKSLYLYDLLIEVDCNYSYECYKSNTH